MRLKMAADQQCFGMNCILEQCSLFDISIKSQSVSDNKIMRSYNNFNADNAGHGLERVKPAHHQPRQEIPVSKFRNLGESSHIRDPLRETQTALDTKKLNMRKIMAAVKYGEKNIEMGSAGDHVVVCWGPTGAGKSSSILTLSGEEMLGYHNKGNPIMMNKDSIAFDIEHHQQLVEEQEVETKIFIQEKATSGTKYPIVKTMETAPGQQSVTLWDTAGFSDNTGHTQTLINAYFLNRIFSLQHKVKLVFCINYASLAADLKGQYFKNDIMRLTEILKDFPSYNKSMALLVTKVAQTADKDDIRDLIKQNMEVIMSQDQGNSELRRFYRYVKSDTMNFMILRRPKLEGKVNQNKPIDVTYQYKEFKQDFYDMVTQRLQPADFPTITVPAGLSAEERRECEDLAIQTAEIIKAEINDFVYRLSNFIKDYYCFSAITDHEATNRDNFIRVNKVKNFLGELSKIVNINTLKGRQTYSQRLDILATFFQNPQFAFESEIVDGKLSCLPLKSLNNSFIIIQFLESIQLGDRCDGVRYEKMIEVLFEAFQSEIRSQRVERYDKELMKKLENFVLDKSQAHVAKWQKQSIFKMWKDSLKQFPSFILKAIKFNPHRHDMTAYFQHIRDTEEEFGIDNKLPAQHIRELLIVAEEYMGKDFDSGALLRNEVGPMVLQSADKMMKADLDFETWGDAVVMEVLSEGQKSQETAKLFREAKIQRFVISKHKQEVKHHYDLRDKIVRDHEQHLVDMDQEYEDMLEEIKRAKKERSKLKDENSRLRSELGTQDCCNVM